MNTYPGVVRSVHQLPVVPHVQPDEPRMHQIDHESQSTHGNESFPRQEAVNKASLTSDAGIDDPRQADGPHRPVGRRVQGVDDGIRLKSQVPEIDAE